VTPTVILGGLNQPFDLPLRQVLAGAIFGIGFPANCALFVSWGDQFESQNCCHFPLLRALTMHVASKSVIGGDNHIHELALITGQWVHPFSQGGL
jgi:hypothetical protein